MTEPVVSSEESAESAGLVIMGRVTGLHGVRGWVKVHSYTRDHLDILEYDPWWLHLNGVWCEIELQEGRPQGRGIVVHLKGYDDREQATTLVGADIAIPRSRLPRLKKGEYYWSQLEGLRVVNLQGIELGRVSHLFETGSNDVLVVVGEREYLLPYLPEVVQAIDLEAGTLHVEWDADF
jgi:16S rRNA processing protein RimM